MKKTVLLVAAASLAFLAALTLFLKNRQHSPLYGPDLSTLRYQEVAFPNGDLTLAGMLFRPAGIGPFPAVVMIHGSGSSVRNDPWYLTVAERLQRDGIAVLLPDKRGSERSGGDWTRSTFQALALDAAAGLKFVRGRTNPAVGCAGVMGFSEGGWIAPIVASGWGRADFAVVMSGAATTTDEQLLFAETNAIADFTGFPILAESFAPLTAMNVRQSDVWRWIAGFDPLPYWREVEVPAFLAFGEGDRTIPVDLSVFRIRQLEKSNIAFRVYPRGGHGITDSDSPQIQEAFLSDLTEFIRGIPACESKTR
jgi:dienelactone hydrolase